MIAPLTPDASQVSSSSQIPSLHNTLSWKHDVNYVCDTLHGTPDVNQTRVARFIILKRIMRRNNCTEPWSATSR